MSKRLWIVCALVLALLCLSVQGAFGAEELTAEIAVDFDVPAFTVTGTAPEGYRECTLLVIKPGVGLPQTSGDFELGAVWADYCENADKGFSFTFPLGVDDAGRYGVYLTATNSTGDIVVKELADETTYFCGRDAVRQLLDDFNGASESTVEGFVTQYSSAENPVLKLDSELYAANTAIVQRDVLSGRQYTTVAQLQEVISRTLLVIDLNQVEKDGFSGALEEYAKKLGIILDDVYYAGKAEVIERLLRYRSEKGKFDGVEDIKEQYALSLMLSEFNRATRETVGSVLQKYQQTLGISLGVDYEAKEGTVHKLMTTDDKKYNSKQDIITRFENALSTADDIATPTPQPNKSPSGNGGGSGGSRGGNVYVAAEDFVPSQGSDGENADSSGSQHTQEMQTGFTDVAPDFWAAESIARMQERGIVNGMGDGSFAPDAEVRREEFVKMLALAFRFPFSDGQENAAAFADTTEGAWYQPYLSALVSRGIVSGMEDNLFGIGRAITRQDAAVLMNRVADSREIALPVVRNTPRFADSVADYAKESIWRLYQAGVINGMDDASFGGMQSLTRAQAVKLIDGLMSAQETGGTR